MVDPITILSGIKLGLQTGKSIAGLSKQIGQFFDATDQAKKTLQKKGVSSKSSNATAMDRWAKLRQAAEAEEELKEFYKEERGRQGIHNVEQVLKKMEDGIPPYFQFTMTFEEAIQSIKENHGEFKLEFDDSPTMLEKDFYES